MCDKDKTVGDWLQIMEAIDENDAAKVDEMKDKNEGVEFDAIDLRFKPGFLEAYFSAD